MPAQPLFLLYYELSTPCPWKSSLLCRPFTASSYIIPSLKLGLQAPSHLFTTGSRAVFLFFLVLLGSFCAISALLYHPLPVLLDKMISFRIKSFTPPFTHLATNAVQTQHGTTEAGTWMCPLKWHPHLPKRDMWHFRQQLKLCLVSRASKPSWDSFLWESSKPHVLSQDVWTLEPGKT